MEVNFTKLGSVPVIKLSFLSPDSAFSTGAGYLQTSLLFRQLAPCYDWAIRWVQLQGDDKAQGGTRALLFLVCFLFPSVSPLAVAVVFTFSSFFVCVFFSVFTFPEPASLHCLRDTSTRGPVPPLQRPGARFCTLLLWSLRFWWPQTLPSPCSLHPRVVAPSCTNCVRLPSEGLLRPFSAAIPVRPIPHIKFFLLTFLVWVFLSWLAPDWKV